MNSFRENIINDLNELVIIVNIFKFINILNIKYDSHDIINVKCFI